MKINVEIDLDGMFDEQGGSVAEMIAGIIKDDIKYQMKRCDGYKDYIKKAAERAVENLGK